MNNNKAKSGLTFINLDAEAFTPYLNGIVHDWSRTLTALAYTLVPIFFILDYFIMPEELLPRFLIYRLVATAIAIAQHIMVRLTRPSRLSYIHGYIVSLIIGGVIVLMTVDLGGFNSQYYAGLCLVIIGVNLLLPWEAINSAINGLLIVIMYVVLNLLSPHDFQTEILVSNLFFMNGTIIIAVSINHVRHKLIKDEFSLRSEVKKARDALWGEMEIAKKIQTSLLPVTEKLECFEISAIMLPAEEVGGDYYDILETTAGEKWISIGDVSGHGVESGLIMMMTQTSIASIIDRNPEQKPSTVIAHVNDVIRKNISRLGVSRYMTIMLIKLEKNQLTFAGKHQDLLLYHSETGTIDVIKTEGTWIGLTNDIGEYLTDYSIEIKKNDILLLFTDGVTEATDQNGIIFGQERLIELFKQYASLPINEITSRILQDITRYQDTQLDDITMLVMKKTI